MSVSRSSLAVRFQDLFEVDDANSSLVVRLGRRRGPDEDFYAGCREEIARRVDEAGLETVVFDLSEMLVLPSSALGLIAAVGQAGTPAKVINPSPAARDDFMMTGLHRLVDVEPESPPPPK